MQKFFFKRIGSGSGQKQTHKNSKQAPRKKGIWLLPMLASKPDLGFLGATNIKTNQNREWKKDYKKFYFENDQLIWSHFLPPANEIYEYFELEHCWSWHLISIKSYKIQLFKFIGRCKPYGFDGEFAEIFYETT